MLVSIVMAMVPAVVMPVSMMMVTVTMVMVAVMMSMRRRVIHRRGHHNRALIIDRLCMIDRCLVIHASRVMVAAVIMAPMRKRSTSYGADDPANDGPIVATNRMSKQTTNPATDDGTSQGVIGVSMRGEQ